MSITLLKRAINQPLPEANTNPLLNWCGRPSIQLTEKKIEYMKALTRMMFKEEPKQESSIHSPERK